MKIPPIAKIYEAYTCIADKRIVLKNDEAIVTSSDKKKTYTVKWKENTYASNDNATFWQGYPGYPVIAVLILQNKLNSNKEIISLFSNINWHELNERHKRNYDKIYEELKNLTLNIKRKI